MTIHLHQQDTQKVDLIPKRSDPGTAPMASLQSALWLGYQQDPLNPAWNSGSVLYLKGALNTAALKLAIEQLAWRHEALRTVFKVEKGAEIQVIQNEIHPEMFAELSYSEVSQSGSEAEFEEWKRHEARRPFDLSTGPVIRWRLVRRAADNHVLTATVHHIAVDAWSMGIVCRELAALYRAFSSGHDSPLPALTIQFGDYCAWDRQEARQKAIETQLEGWLRRLDGIPESIPFQTDGTRLGTRTTEGSRVFFDVSADLTREATLLGRRHGATLFMVLLAVFKTLLYRYCGEEDCVVAVPTANRRSRELDGVVGFIANALAIRTNLSGNPTFREVISRVRESSLYAFANPDVPWITLQTEIKRKSGRVLAQVLFGFLNIPFHGWQFHDIETSLDEIFPGTVPSTTDLGFHFYENDDGLRCVVRFPTDLFEDQTVERICERYVRLLASVVRDPDKPIAAYSLFDRTEWKFLLSGGTSAVDYDRYSTIDRQFLQQVERTPDAIAVVAGDRKLDYRSLANWSARIAAELTRCGAPPESRVGVCLERSPELLAGLLGVWMAGYAYVPLDLMVPSERLAFMLSHSQASILLTQPSFEQRFSKYQGRTVMIPAFDPGDSKASETFSRSPEPTTLADDCACVFYTSGSTGQPKGVAVTHRNILARFASFDPVVDLPESNRTFLALTTTSFDISVLELFWTLCRGYKVVLSSPYTLGKGAWGEPFLEKVREHGVSHFQCTPAVARILSENPKACFALQELRMLLVGGEALSVSLARRLRQEGTGQILNMYGPTETTIWTTAHRIDEVGRTLPIGRPLANTPVYILDRALDLCPADIPGEVYIGGDSVTRGYLGNPALTAERFLPDPFSTISGSRMYQTGDRGRYTSDGKIEFLGRLDRQLKIRAHRVEPSEIEMIIRDHPVVADCYVAATKTDETDAQLIGYVSPRMNSTTGGAVEALEIEWSSHVGGRILKWDQIYQDTPDPREDPSESWQSALESTASLIRGLNPRRILEIGSGRGDLASRLRGSCEYYLATDASPVALEALRQRFQQPFANLQWQRLEAIDVSELTPHTFDTAVLDGVVQDFPSIEYLSRVLEGLAQLLQPGGKVVLTGIRDFRLLTYSAAVSEARQTEGRLDRNAIRVLARRRLWLESDLAIDPALFTCLRERLPRLKWVESLPAGSGPLSDQYSVVLHFDFNHDSGHLVDLDWIESDLTPAKALDILTNPSGSRPARIRGIPNALLTAHRTMKAWLEDQTARVAGRFEDVTSAPAAVNPLEFLRLADERQLKLRILTNVANPFDFDVETGFHEVIEPVRNEHWNAPFNPDVRLEPLFSDPLRTRRMERLAIDLRGYAAERLPFYMAPTMFVMMDEIPRTASGKVDPQILPQPEAIKTPEYVAPSSPTEIAVASIWADVLKVERIGIHEDFFDLGGHSLLALQILGRLSSAFSLELTLQDLVELTTVASIARTIESILAEGRTARIEPIVPVDRSGQIPISLPQEGRLLFELGAETHGAAYLQGITPLGLSLAGRLDINILIRAINDTVNRHESLRTGFFPTAYVGAFKMEGWQKIRAFFDSRNSALKPKLSLTQRIFPHVEVPVSGVSLEDTAVSDRRTALGGLLKELVETSFDYETPPLLRAMLVRINAELHFLYVVLSHVIADGWSIALFSSEVSARYSALASGTEPPTAPNALQYADFAAWQRQRLRGKILDRMLAYCDRRFKHGDPLSADELPFARAPWRGNLGSTQVLFPFDRSLAGQVRKYARERRTTPYVILLAAFNIVLSVLTERSRIGLWTFLANRSHPDTEAMIGWFAQDHLLVMDMSNDPTVTEIVQQARAVVLDANLFQDVPPQLIARAINQTTKRQLRISFETLAQPQTQHGTSPRGLRVGPIPIPRNQRHPEAGLKVRVQDGGTGPLSLHVQCATDRFQKEDIEGLLSRLGRVALQMVQFPYARLSRFRGGENL